MTFIDLLHLSLRFGDDPQIGFLLACEHVDKLWIFDVRQGWHQNVRPFYQEIA